VVYATNAWNQYFGTANAGNQNNNNKNNTNIRVRPVRRTTVTVTGPDLTSKEVLQAYLDCRKRKRGKDATTLFETNLSHNIAKITRRLQDYSWRPGSSMCFVVTIPKAREIWAATFADRVVHHVIYNRLRPRIEPGFITTSFACIPKRGTLAAANWAHQSMRRATNGWTRPAWALQLDVANFFPSIDRNHLWSQVEPHCTEPWLESAVFHVVHHDVTKNAYLPGNPAELDAVPMKKSLWYAEPGKGLPIGNLTSQFCANVYMNEVDHFIEKRVRPRYYGRYVDDFLLIDQDKGRLLEARDQIDRFMKEKLSLTLHHGKTHLQPVSHGIDFVGWRLLPYRRYFRQNAAARAALAIREHAGDPDELLATLNAYLGVARHGNTFNLRSSWCEKASSDGVLVASPDRLKVMRRPR
jgi:RNA-directed DNA polymerase